MRGEPLLRAVDGLFIRFDRLLHRGLPEQFNPLAQSGAVANTSLVIAVVSGVFLLIWYSPSVYQAWPSLEVLRQGGGILTRLGQFMRSLHRYSSDLCMFFVALHALRMLVARRFGGARWLAWVTGIALLAALWFVGWLGYWLVWDERAQQVAIGTSRMLDVIPIFGDPPSRTFLANRAVSSMLFFIIFFCHMLLPLVMGVALWLHITRLSRSKFFTGYTMTWLVLGALAVLSLVIPATSAGPAQMTVSPTAARFDAWYLLPLLLTDRLGGGALCALTLFTGAVITAVPWLLVRGRATPAVVNVSHCNSCRRCYEDCPYQAITMVPRTDGRGFVAQAQVDASKCVGCGICAGSCDSAGIDLPWLDVVVQRAKLDAWVDKACGADADPHVAFVCAESAGGFVDTDATTGRSESLPGYRVMPVPCIGWVHQLTVERAMRHGAAGVLMVGCAPGGCMYREGVDWTTQRIAGDREPALRTDKVDAERVRLVRFDRLDPKAFVREAAAFRAGTPRPERKRARGREVATGAALAVLLGGATVLVAAAPYGGPPASPPALVISFKHPGLVSEDCHVVTPEENELVPIHMRRDRICARGRAPVRLRVRVDGQVVFTRSYAPRGVHGDEPAIALERLPMTEGRHAIALEIGDTRDATEWTWRDARTMEFRRNRRAVVLFDRSSQFTWE